MGEGRGDTKEKGWEGECLEEGRVAPWTFIFHPYIETSKKTGVPPKNFTFTEEFYPERMDL